MSEKLSNEAKADLKKILAKEIGIEITNGLSDEELNTIGVLLLTILAEGLKMKVASPELFASRM